MKNINSALVSCPHRMNAMHVLVNMRKKLQVS